MIKIGIVGTGNIVGISHFHTMSLIKDGRAEIAAVYDARIDGASQWVREHGLNSKVCNSYDDLLDCVDAVNICVPNKFHYEYTKCAILAEKHFLVEKPMAMSLEECNSLNDLCSNYKKTNMVGFVYRYSNAVKLARKIVQDKIGPVYTMSAWFGGKRLSDPTIPLEWRMIRSLSGSGALGDFGSHLIDLADYVAGQRYREVTCLTDCSIKTRTGKSGKSEEVENDDSSVFCCKGDNGLGTFTVSRVGMDDVMLMITGQGGMLQLSLRGNGSLIYWDKKPDGGYTGSVKEIEFEPQVPFDGWFDDEMSLYLDAIEGKQESYADIMQGCYVESVIHIAEEAALNKVTKEISL